MSYKNGKDILPASLLRELQKYIQGELVYIPKTNSKRAGWGEANGTRLLIEARNREIYRMYKNGTPIIELIRQYHLSEDSIRKIIVKTRSAARSGTVPPGQRQEAGQT